MSAEFASTADLADKPITFDAIGPDLYAFSTLSPPRATPIPGLLSAMTVSWSSMRRQRL
jgi:hypothetical protein